MNHETFKILIVDDSLFNREILRRILKEDEAKMGIAPEDTRYEIITADSGEAALVSVENDHPDLMLLDIVMPGISGFEVLERLQQDEMNKNMPVIVISGLDSENDEEKSFMLGAVDFITKPFANTIVTARIKTHLRIIEQMRIIERISLSDQLTGLPNRRSFDNRMAFSWKLAIRDQKPIAAMMIDIDFFKKFNDNYGHQQGDVTLIEVGAAIESVVKRPLDFAARWGGEEFVVLLPNTDLPGAMFVAEQIRLTIGSTQVPRLDGGDPLHVTASLGVCVWTPTLDHDMDEFLKHADEALYAAKESGRNRVCYSDKSEGSVE